MKTYDVYAHPLREQEAVKQGFSWPGFFFGWIWAFVKRLPPHGFALLGVGIVMGVIDAGAETPEISVVLSMVGLAIAVAIGFNGNEWRRDRLCQLGYKHMGSFHAATSDGAIAQAMNADKAGVVLPESHAA